MPRRKKHKYSKREKFQAGIRKAFSGVGLKKAKQRKEKQSKEEQRKREAAYLKKLEDM